ncbi:MAG: hypothetical protein HYW28_05930 [Rhodospirillales bacterium]|nr:hypothetical protein [Rhodospirillales bacterium]
MVGYVFEFAWGFVVLAAFIGWGGVASQVLGRFGGASETTHPDWGLAAGWGMALVLAAGGVLSLASLARPWLLVALVVVGAALAGRRLVAGPRPMPVDRRLWCLMALAVVPLLTRYAGAVTHQAMSCSDDNIAYFAFVARLLDTGTLLEPFSLRRLSAYGGQTFLQALVMAVGDEDNAYLIDRGVAFIVAFGLVIGFFREPGRGGESGLKPVHYLVTLALVVILPLPLLNSSSHVTGLALFLTLFRTLERAPPDAAGTAPARLWMIGLVAAGAASLKATFLVMAAATLVAWWLIGTWRRCGKGGRDWRRHVVVATHLAASTLTFLAPWMALLYRSSATPLFPIVQGHHRPGFAATYSGDLPLAELAAFLGDFLIQPQVGLFLVPILLYAFRRGSPAGLALYAGAITTAAATVMTLTYDNIETLHRYVAPFVNAAFIATTIAFADDARRAMPTAADGRRRRRTGDAILWVLVLALLPVPIHHDVKRIADTYGQAILTAENRAAYARVQAAVPAGKKLLVLVNHPFAFDYQRNVIVNVDVPGAVSPDPGMPFFQGPGALKAYLKGQSIRAVAFRDFAAPGGCLYGRDLWLAHAQGDNPMWRAQSKYYLDLMDNVLKLAAAERVVHRDRGLTVIALD